MILKSPTRLGQGRVVHGFATRSLHGAPLDLARGAGDAQWARVASALGLPGAPVRRLHQVHGARVHTAGRAEPDEDPVADALITCDAGVLLAVRTADCVPVLIAGEVGVAAIHAGWRGLTRGVIEAAVQALARLDPGPLHAVVGPAICGGCYEVGLEVQQAVFEVVGSALCRSAEPGACTPGAPRRAASGTAVDLPAAAEILALRAGCASVSRVHACTYGRADLYSHRRASHQGQAETEGRQASLIGLLPRAVPS